MAATGGAVSALTTAVTTAATGADGIAQAKAAVAGNLSGAAATAQNKAIAKAQALLDHAFGSAASATGKMTQYSEVNATATASVATDMGWTVTAAISVDAGTGYDFADDDTFDGAKANGVGLDSVSIDFGAGGKLTLDRRRSIAHLVDADDDAAGDLLYTNTLGTASVSIAADIDDGDVRHQSVRSNISPMLQLVDAAF